MVKAWNTNFAGTLVEGGVAGQPLDVFVAGDEAGPRSPSSIWWSPGGPGP
jgi:predicted dinucleotide-binding enzyme